MTFSDLLTYIMLYEQDCENNRTKPSQLSNICDILIAKIIDFCEVNKIREICEKNPNAFLNDGEKRWFYQLLDADCLDIMKSKSNYPSIQAIQRIIGALHLDEIKLEKSEKPEKTAETLIEKPDNTMLNFYMMDVDNNNDNYKDNNDTEALMAIVDAIDYIHEKNAAMHNTQATNHSSQTKITSSSSSQYDEKAEKNNNSMDYQTSSKSTPKRAREEEDDAYMPSAKKPRKNQSNKSKTLPPDLTISSSFPIPIMDELSSQFNTSSNFTFPQPPVSPFITYNIPKQTEQVKTRTRKQKPLSENSENTATDYMDSSVFDLLKPESMVLIQLSTDPIYSLIIKREEELLKVIKADRTNNIFNMSHADLIEAVTLLAEHVFNTLESTDFILKDSEDNPYIHITREVFNKAYELCKKYFPVEDESSPTQYNRYIINAKQARERILAHLLTIRLYGEIKSSEMPYPVHKVSKEKSADHFKKLCAFNAEDSKYEKYTNRIPFTYTIGNKTVDYYTYKYRIQAHLTHNGSNIPNPIDIWDSSKNSISELSKQFREYLKFCNGQKNYYNGTDTKKLKSVAINNRIIEKSIHSNGVPTQFPPTVLLFTIAALKQKYQFILPAGKAALYAPLSGWGGRPLAAFAHKDFETVTIVDANPDVVNATQLMHQNIMHEDFMHQDLVPKTKKLRALNKKIEELRIDEVGGVESHDLLVTSPIYMGREVYNGTLDIDYNTKANWNNFKYHLMRQSLAVKYGGMVVINIAPILENKVMIDLPNQIKKSMEKYSVAFQLDYLGMIPGVMKGTAGFDNSEMFVIGRRSANLGSPKRNSITFFNENKSEISDDESASQQFKFS